MRLNDEQNIAFANDPRRVAAQNRLNRAVKRIHDCLDFQGNAEYYLMVLPGSLKELEDANENLILVEAAIEAELTGSERWHG